MKLACVIQRFGAEVTGGSERHCRVIAEQLASHHDVTVLTSCAQDYVTWRNVYPAGASRAGSVNVLRFPVARERNLGRLADISRIVFTTRSSPEEQELMKALLDYPALVAGAAEALEPHRVATYLHDTAGKIHVWYHKAHVLNEPEAITKARLVLARASQIVLRNGLALLGISAPERM